MRAGVECFSRKEENIFLFRMRSYADIETLIPGTTLSPIRRSLTRRKDTELRPLNIIR